MAAKLKVTQVKSTISHIARNRATVRALGLHGIGSTSIITDNPATRGMVRQVRFLVTVEEIADDRRPGRRHETPRPPPGRWLAPAAHPRRPRDRRRQGQDRGPRHQGPEGARRWRASRAWFEGGQTPLHMRIPKLRGFKNRFKIEYEVVNIGAIGALAEARRVRARGRPARSRRKSAPITVNQDILRAVGLVRTLNKPLKILGAGELSVAAVRRRRRVHRVGPGQDRGRRRQRQRPRGPEARRWPRSA